MRSLLNTLVTQGPNVVWPMINNTKYTKMKKFSLLKSKCQLLNIYMPLNNRLSMVLPEDMNRVSSFHNKIACKDSLF